MNCKHCGTEISAKAIVCFRCGRSTAEPASAGRTPGPAAAWPMWVAAAGLVVLVLAGLFMARAATGQVPPAVSYTVAALAAVVLAWRLARRGKR